MKKTISSPADLGLLIRAVRKNTNVRQDDLSAIAGVSRQFAIDAERGKPTLQFGRVFRLLQELGITLSADVPDDVAQMLEKLRSKPPRKSTAAAKGAAPAKPARKD